jgi:hypothetical protein
MYSELETNIGQVKQETNRVLKNMAPHSVGSSVLLFFAVKFDNPVSYKLVFQNKIIFYEACNNNNKLRTKTKLNSVARIITTKRPQLVGKVSADFSG